jgi:hypothetical protein
MYFGMCIYETLSSDGRIESILVNPSGDADMLVADRRSDVGPNLSRDVDIGPLRFYTNEQGLSVRTAAARLSSLAFRARDENLEVKIEHLNWPLKPVHAGYYILLLPPGYVGNVRTSANEHELIFMSDVQQLLLSATVVPASPSLTVVAKLQKGTQPSSSIVQKTSVEVFGTTLPGVHYTPVDNLLRALHQDLNNAASAFLCHSSSDKVEVRRLAIELATRGVRPWIDEAEIRTGDSLIDKIQRGISSSTCLVPVLSKASVESRWCKEELRMALAMQVKSGNKRVLPVIIDDCEIPGFLLEKAYADLRDLSRFGDRVDRLAADIRELHDSDNQS